MPNLFFSENAIHFYLLNSLSVLKLKGNGYAYREAVLSLFVPSFRIMEQILSF